MDQPESGGPRLRRHRANLERIVDAASQIVFEHGLDALSVKRVADLADYTPGALYRYFPSKDAMLEAVVLRVVADLGERIRAAAEAEADPLARLVAIARAYRRFALESPHEFALLSSMIGDPRWVVTEQTSALAILQAAMEVALPLAGALGEASERALLSPDRGAPRAIAFFTALQGAMQFRKYELRFPSLAPPDAVFDTVVRAMLSGFGAPESALDAAFATRT